MYVVSKDEYDIYKTSLFKHYLEGNSRDAELSNVKSETMKKFINSYFQQIFKKSGEGSNDHMDWKRMRRDEYGIPQDLSKRYTIRAQKDIPTLPSQYQHIPPWLVRHFEFALQLYQDFENDLKFKKMKALRNSQRELPIAERRDEILDLISKNQVLIIAGDTGCGKSTQVPQYLMNAGYSGIACTQPRRIACTALSRRVSYETLNTYGSEVAFQIRFETTKSKRTKMLFLTEGLLLRQMENDSLLQNYNIIILDEVHERHLSSDLLVGLLRDLIDKRTDLKIILMSATINLELFTDYFKSAPVIQVPGRLYPIQLKYHPIKLLMADNSNKKSVAIDPEPYLRILELIDKEVLSTERGDVLIFLNGVAEMTRVAETLKTYAEINKSWIILMLHSTLSIEEQDKVFDIAPEGVRKCILSTNIAETSVTIDGIRFVIDSGKVNLVKYDTSSGTQKLSEFWVSKASANQRKGRAGRTGPGICYRLYSQEQYDKMEDFTLSEINRVSLQEMALRMISLNLGLDPRTFPYIERPADESLTECLEILKFQGILYPDRENQLTALGYTVAKLPVAVPIAKMLVLGCMFDQLEVILTVAASLSLQSPFTNRSFRDLDVVKRRESLTSPMGDAFTLVNVFREWVMQKSFGGRSHRWSIDNGIDEHRLYEVSKLRVQYRQILEDAELIKKPTAEELGETDSRQRRINEGEKRKLRDMKTSARQKGETRKILRANKHFDSILEDKEEEDLEREEDPMKADVKTVEFLLGHKQRDVEMIRKTHKLSRKDAEVIRLVVAAGLYAQYSLLDSHNSYRQGHELFVHTRQKPYVLLHPNSDIAQYHSESINPHGDREGRSALHQILFYGLLLETTKPYICNVLPIPAILLIIVAKKVVCDDNWKTIAVDDFVEFVFDKPTDCEDTIHIIKQIRHLLATGLTSKLKGNEYSPRELIRLVDKIGYRIVDKQTVYSVNRLMDSPKEMENAGFFDKYGKMKSDHESNEEESEGEIMRKEDRKIREAMAFDVMQPEREESKEENEDRIEEKKEEKKESYYQILLKRRKEKEVSEIIDKRIKEEETAD